MSKFVSMPARMWLCSPWSADAPPGERQGGESAMLMERMATSSRSSRSPLILTEKKGPITLRLSIAVLPYRR